MTIKPTSLLFVIVAVIGLAIYYGFRPQPTS